MTHVRRRTLIGAGLLAVYVVVFAILVAFDRLSVHRAVLDVMGTGAALAAVTLCGLAALKAQDRFMTWYWGLFALANLCAAIAEAVWAVYELILGIDSPYPSLADVARLAFYPLAFAGLLRLTAGRGRKRMSEATSTLDALMFSAAGVGLAWEFLMVPVLDPSATSLANVTSLAYPVGDLLLLGALTSLAVSATRRAMPRGTPWVVASFVVMLLADFVYTRMVVTESYATGAWVDPLWPLSYALLSIGTLVYLDARSRGQRVETHATGTSGAPRAGPAEFMRRNAPYVAVLVAAFLSYYHFVLQGGSGPMEDTVMVVITSIIPILVLTRQLLISIENRRLHASLVDASGVLEERVIERTQELAAEKDRLNLLNQAAREIGRCTTVQEVLRAGARLLVKASHCEAVALSALNPRGRLNFATNRDLADASQRWLKGTLRRFLLENRGTIDASPVRYDLPPAESSGSIDAATAAGPFGAAMIFPLVFRRTMLGAACLAFEYSDHGVQHEETSTVQNIVAQIAVALQNAQRYDEARFLADSDALTGLANHRSVTERLEQEIARSVRSKSHFSLIMMDVDEFKQFNDTYGHVVGDQALVAVSTALKQAVRAGDILGRFGGDEFVAILPQTDTAGAIQVVERINKELAEHPVAVGGAALPALNVSCGIAVFPLHGRQAEELLSVADENMYYSKRNEGPRAATSEPGESRAEISVGAFNVLDSLITTIDRKDHYTRRHSEDVARFAVALGDELGLAYQESRSLRVAGLLHDVGKIGIPDQLLLKPGPLTKEEYEVVKQHSGVGELIIGEIPNLRGMRDDVAAHHERYDGQGYPRGLAGEEIPLRARILAVADAYAAMTSDRPHHRALSLGGAEAELRKVSGTQLDPSVVNALLAILHRADGYERAPAKAPNAGSQTVHATEMH